MDVIPFASPPSQGSAFNGFVGFKDGAVAVTPTGPFFGGAANGGALPLLTTFVHRLVGG